MNKLILPLSPFNSSITLLDMITGIPILKFEDAITVIEPVIIEHVNPRAQFSLIEKINLTLTVNSPIKMTHCIQVIDK